MDSINVFYFVNFICWNYELYVMLEFKKKKGNLQRYFFLSPYRATNYFER